jgi:2-polyprenyl-3-methyl-5-hydroxy-6-metoxy-1,4-benzoquinol methylase
MEVLTTCPVCDGTLFENYMNCVDYTVSRETFTIQKCKTCGFLFTNPRPAESEIGRYYKAEAYISHTDSSKGVINKLYKRVRSITLRLKYTLIKPALKNNRLLDIGAGTGAFLDHCKRKGVDVYGIEPDADARAIAQVNYGLNLQEEPSIAQFKSEQFSVITMWHVLEHVSELNQRVAELRRLLTDDGRIYIAVPNHKSSDAKYYGASWAAYDVPRHLYHFEQKTIQHLFEKHKLHLEKVIPMKFDAFYVSLLSEQYKTGKSNLFSGFLRGILSNLNAKTDTWSSQVYVFRK